MYNKAYLNIFRPPKVLILLLVMDPSGGELRIFLYVIALYVALKSGGLSYNNLQAMSEAFRRPKNSNTRARELYDLTTLIKRALTPAMLRNARAAVRHRVRAQVVAGRVRSLQYE